MNSEDAFINFKALQSTIDFKNINSEADTRCKIIDKILIDCLGWSENNLTREDKNFVGFTDYILKINDIPYLIIEAKKTGVYFEIPNDYNKRRYKITGIISTIKNLNEAINQIRNYCINTGIRFAVITNGYQYIVFSAFSQGKKWEDVECIIFKSIEDISRIFIYSGIFFLLKVFLKVH